MRMPLKKLRGDSLDHSLPAATVKRIAGQDRSIRSLAVGSQALIARSADAFLKDLVGAAVKRARTTKEGSRKSKNIQVDTLVLTAAEEERFDFLQPVLESLDARKTLHVRSTRPATNTRRKLSEAAQTRPADEGSISDPMGEVKAGATSDSAAEGEIRLSQKAEAILRKGTGLTTEDCRALVVGSTDGTGARGASSGGARDVEDDAYDDDYDDC